MALVDPSDALTYRPGMRLEDRIHYACGLNFMGGWTNTDWFDEKSFPGGVVPPELIGKVYHVDLSSRQPFPDNTFQFAYSEDFIEHLSQKDAITFLFETRRVLRPGGVLRIATPGLIDVMDRHYVGREYEQLAVEHYHCYDRWSHCHFFSHDTLRAVALAAGYRRYQQRIFGVSDHDALRGIDTRADQQEFNIYAEMTK